MDLESQWETFMTEDFDVNELNNFSINSSPIDSNNTKDIPISSDLKISTKTKLLYLNHTFNLKELFFTLKTIDYDDEKEGIIKKQIKFNFNNKEDVDYFESMIKNEKNVKMKILNQINNPTGRVKFKDVRKVDIGFCNNDVVSPKKESKSAFYNCFVINYRKKYKGKFVEFHVKLFNSGKIEVPGIHNEDLLNIIINQVIESLQPHFKTKIFEIVEKRELILINSNFNCNYYLNREKLVKILKSKYKIKCNLDSCNYPGIQCKYKLEDNREISFMIFRTGSVLIVGKCEEDELIVIYNYLVDIFKNEYLNIVESQSELEIIEKNKSPKNKKKTRKFITIYK